MKAKSYTRSLYVRNDIFHLVLWKARIIFDSVCFSSKPFILCAKKESSLACIWKIKYIISHIAVKTGLKLFWFHTIRINFQSPVSKRCCLQWHIHFVNSWTDSSNTFISVLQKEYFWEVKNNYRKNSSFPLFPFLFPLFSAFLIWWGGNPVVNHHPIENKQDFLSLSLS